MAQSSKLTFLVQDAWSLVHKYSVQTTVGLLFVYVLHVVSLPSARLCGGAYTRCS